MQLNGLGSQTVTMSEPPEPPPRNPEKINASLKHLSDTKSTKSLDHQSSQQNSTSTKIFKSILSLDTQAMSQATGNQGTSTSPKSSGSESNHHHDQLRGAASQLFSAATSTISNKINELVNGSGLVLVAGSENTPVPASTTPTANNNKISPTATKLAATTAVVAAENNNQTSPEAQTTTTATTTAEEQHVSGRVSVALDQQKTLIFPNETASLYIERRDNSNDSIGNGSKVGDELESPRTMEIRLENERLHAEIAELKLMLREQSPEGAVGGNRNSYGSASNEESNVRVEKLENELRIAKELIQSLKSERKKLRDDKNDLLNQVKQLCISLQDKEKELRTFIRTFEQRIRDSESIAMKNNSDRERERWSLLKTARDEAERSLALAAQLNARDMQLQRTQDQLQEARRQLSEFTSDQESIVSMAPITPPPNTGIMSHMGGPNVGYTNLGSTPGDRGSCSADSGVRGNSDRESAAGDLQLSDGPCENGPCITVDSDSISLVSSHHNMYQYGTPKERSPTLSPLNAANFSRSVDSSALSRSVEQLGSPDNEGPPVMRRTSNKINSLTTRLTGRGGTWGSISRVFARSRRNKNQIVEQETQDFQWSPLTEEGYAEKLRLLREASTVPMERWRASQVLAWLEVALGMPQYSSRCTENVKSGKVLLELSDAELETGLGATHPMHRKKLRLAIEEHRRPDLVRYPTIGQLGHTWVASEWLPDIGLPQYAEPFLHSLVDARMLDTLSKKELEKYLGVTKKFHQASIVHAIHVLRIIKYDRQTLAVRRLQSENMDADPIVWTNQRFIRWARSIDLGEYADNLKDSGVHGGLVVLEPSFSGETMAMALGIPQSKSIIRRHLITEFEALVLPARSHLGQGIRTHGSNQVIPITGPGGLQKSSGSLRYTTWKGSQTSLSRTFGFRSSRSRSERTSTSPTPSYSSSEGGNYATIGQMIQHLPPPTTTPPPIPINNRISAPPIAGHHSTLPRSSSQHRRVKSISDIGSAAGNQRPEDVEYEMHSPMGERQPPPPTEAIYREIQKKSLRAMQE
ncbi:kazrin [Culicoides brevitarsis]|uniref:kazrin n=1 Tax=Culicoides brevitarsis TaxID=469753 RepID=UPI00307B1E52